MTDPIAALSERIAAMTGEDEIALMPDMFGATLASVSDTAGMVLRPANGRILSLVEAENDIPFEAVDHGAMVECLAERDGYRGFGLWLFALLFSGRDWAGLHLTRPETALTHFYVRVLHAEPRDPFLRMTRPVAEEYRYGPAPVVRHPFADPPMGDPMRVAVEDRPMIRFGWSDDAARHRGRAEEADQLLLHLTPEGLCALAALMLDFAMPWSAANEIDLEAPFTGFAATQPLSVDLRFWLPGSVGFPQDGLDAFVPAPSAR